MKTSVLFAVLAIGAVAALAGLAAAAGPAASALGMNNSGATGNGAMERGGGCWGSDGQSEQYQYRYGGDCPGACQAELRNNYSWSHGDGNMTCTCSETQTMLQNQGADCPGTCDNCNDWDHSWNWDHNYGGQ